MLKYFDMFSGIGGFRAGFDTTSSALCVGHCEIDKFANQSYETIHDVKKGEYYCSDARNIDTNTMPDFDLLCAGFPCQPFSQAGERKGFDDTRGTLFFEIARVVRAKRPQYLLLENVPGLLTHDKGRTFCTILSTLNELGYHVEWQVLDSKNFGVPQTRKRVYAFCYLDPRCAGKVLPIIGTNSSVLRQLVKGRQGERVYAADGIACTLTSNGEGFATKTGLYFIDLNTPTPVLTPARLEKRQNGKRYREPGAPMFTITTQDRHGIMLKERIRKLTPTECLRLQGFSEPHIEKLTALQSDAQLYKQAGNSVTVNVIKAIAERIVNLHA
jgi:DNA (cytosine-5)-methyltransferase 1